MTVIDRHRELSGLLQRTAEHDTVAFATLYRISSPRLYGIALRLLGGVELAGTALEACYVHVWRNASRFHPGRHDPMTWMTSILRAHALDLRRSDAGRIDPEAATDAGEADPDLCQVFEAPLEPPVHGEGGLPRCLARLPERPRECLLRAYREGLSAEELAARLDTPLGSVKSSLRRALGMLEECLDGSL